MRDNSLSLSATSDPVAQLEKWTLDGEEEKCAASVNAKLDQNDRAPRGELDLMAGAQLLHLVNDKLVREINTVGDAGDKHHAGPMPSTKGETRAQRADEQPGHSQRTQGELADAGGDRQHIAVAQIERESTRH